MRETAGSTKAQSCAHLRYSLRWPRITPGPSCSHVGPNTFIGLNEAQVLAWSAILATAVATIAIFSQRSIAARQTTIEFIQKSEADRDLIKARELFLKLARDPSGLGQWASQPLSKEFKAIRTVLNEYEVVAIGIQRGIFDDTTYRRWYRSGVVKSWNHASPFVLARRITTGNDTLWHEFEEMARWYRGGPPMPRRHFIWRKFV